jgi:TatD DNase family protein
MLIDTHCHLDMVHLLQEKQIITAKDLQPIGEIIKRAELQGVTKIINVGCDVASSYNSLYLSENFTNVFATVGIHPTECNVEWKEAFAELVKLIETRPKSKLVGIGEIGLDYYHKPNNPQKQRDAFVAQMELALKLNLPVSIHVRDAADDALKIIEPYAKIGLRGVMHCFQQSAEFAKIATSWGFYLGVDGPVDYPKNQSLRDTFKSIGLKNLLLETDAPFLPPQAFRGKRNEPAYLVNVADTLAKIFNMDRETVAKITSTNAKRLFGDL